MTFFGLTSSNYKEARVSLFSQIHEIVFNGKGGYSWETVYNMPIWLRRFTFNKLKQYYENPTDDSQSNVVIDKNGLIKNQSLVPKENIPNISKPGISPKSPIKYK